MDAKGSAKEVLTLYEASFQEKKISTELLCSPDLPKAWADPEKIAEVLINLVGNAIKFTPAGGRVEVSLEHLVPKKLIRFCVTDTGMGISEKDQLTIFNKFEQVQTARSQIKGPKGTGLGLSSCRELITLHGGEIGVTSHLGQGSTFYFTLPAAEMPAMAAPT